MISSIKPIDGSPLSIVASPAHTVQWRGRTVALIAAGIVIGAAGAALFLLVAGKTALFAGPILMGLGGALLISGAGYGISSRRFERREAIRLHRSEIQIAERAKREAERSALVSSRKALKEEIAQSIQENIDAGVPDNFLWNYLSKQNAKILSQMHIYRNNEGGFTFCYGSRYMSVYSDGDWIKH